MLVLTVFAALILLLVFVVCVRTARLKTPSVDVARKSEERLPMPEGAADRLAAAIRIKSVSSEDYSETDFSPFDEFVAFLRGAYPRVYAETEQERVNTYGLIYRWKGTDSSRKPVLFIAHYDVVPVEEAGAEDWKYGGFSGEIAEGRVWGRGTLDVKSQVTALMETAQNLMAKGYVPKRDIYFAFGHDEEVGGLHGAKQIAAWFKERQITFESVYDEGGMVITGAISGVRPPVALIGVAEKGYMDLRIRITDDGGHSSMPPKHTALGRLSDVVTCIEKRPMKAKLTVPVENMLRNICGEMGIAVKIAVANLWLFKPLLLKILSLSPTTDALIRTTTAATMAKASDAANVLPQNAECIVNFRLLQSDTSADVIDHVRKACGNKQAELITMRIEEPSQVSPVDAFGYKKLVKVIGEVYPESLPAPYLVMGATDSRKYYEVCDHVYRFMPISITDEEKKTMHAVNESISLENYGRMIYFFEKLIRELDQI